MINCLLDRSYKIICDEFEQIKTILSRNRGECVHEFFNCKFATKPLFSKKKYSTPKKIFICLPFLGALLLQIRNELKAFFRKPTNVKA